ncbi:uncharacterized protein MEPE_06421 [Melanopsichium pennsylvanicum]|uniref:LYC1 C-terminal domain-containing protein n=2 Tax=Melanopsichium pennsylvanicum TaxID=63383 RepID=A0AAJ4XTJ0_9BASI|nr:conserved hypothetical protein [Melanopsichium pennsylvanicum 4]SNX87711.1 uncharacterized protein MEPE_06421 [Melanopsichium pennsylvanicum]
MNMPTIAGHVLVPATPAQDQIATEREHLEWGAPLLSLDQFITREKRVLGITDFSTTRRQRWVLVPADNTTTTDFLSACETYRRPILLKRPGNQVQRALSYSVCSVFVPESKRRNGYAARMMSLLQMNLSPQANIPASLDDVHEIKDSSAVSANLDADQAELSDGGNYGRNATLSFLYSDIGTYYSQFGWKVTGARHVEWTPRSSSSSSDSDALPAHAQWLTAEDLPELGRADREYLVSQLERHSHQENVIRFALDDPEATSWRWLIQRSMFYAHTLMPESQTKPIHFGLKLGDSWAVWMFDFVDKKVAILRLKFSSPQAFAQLIGAVRRQAAEFGMAKVVGWNVDLSSLGVDLAEADQERLKQGEKLDKYEKQLAGGKVVERSGNSASLPALAWYGDKKAGERVEWVANEYGWWC